MQNSSGGHDPFGGDPFSWTPPLKASGATLNPTAERPAISSPDADIFDLFGPSHGAPQPQLVPNLVSNGTDAQAGAASGSSNAPMSMPDPFGIAFNSRAGERTPAMAAQRAAAGQRMPGSSESSLSQPYEDARSRGYTPETVASLLDFDTPFASPVSPTRVPWQPSPSPLSEDTTHVGGPSGADVAHGQALADMQPDLWVSMGAFSNRQPNGDTGAAAWEEPAELGRSRGVDASDQLSFNDSDASASVLSSLDELDPLDVDMAAEVTDGVVTAPATIQPVRVEESSALASEEPATLAGATEPAMRKEQQMQLSEELERQAWACGEAKASEAGASGRTEPVSIVQSDISDVAAAAAPLPGDQVTEGFGESETGGNSLDDVLSSSMADLEGLAESGARIGREGEEADGGGDLMEQWQQQRQPPPEPRGPSGEPAPSHVAAAPEIGSESEAADAAEFEEDRRRPPPPPQPLLEERVRMVGSSQPQRAMQDSEGAPGLAASASLDFAESDLSMSDLGEDEEAVTVLEEPFVEHFSKEASASDSAHAFARDIRDMPLETGQEPSSAALAEDSRHPEGPEEEPPSAKPSAPPPVSQSSLSEARSSAAAPIPRNSHAAPCDHPEDLDEASVRGGATESEHPRGVQDSGLPKGGPEMTDRVSALGRGVEGRTAGADGLAAGPAAPEGSSLGACEDSVPSVPSVASEEGKSRDALAQAEALERNLVTGSGEAGLGAEEEPHGTPLLNLRRRLARAGHDWPHDGADGPRGSTVGGSFSARIDSLPALSQAATNYRVYGAARCVACFHGVVALGTSSGVTFVLLPRGLHADAGPDAGPKVMRLGEARPGDGVEVSALGFSPAGNLLGVGHANGDVAFWELKRSGWECAKTVKDGHVTAVVGCAFLEGGNAADRSAALTCDSRGRLVYHNVSAYLSLTTFLAGRLGKGAQPLLVLDGRQLGPICKIVPLPLPRALLAGRAANADDAARNLFFQDGASPLDGMVLLCTARAAYVGRLSLPDGRLNILHNIPRPPDAPQGCVPYASWRLSSGGSPQRAVGASLALAWGRRTLLLDVHLFRLPPDATSAPGGPQGEAEAAPTPAAPLLAAVVQSWEAEHEVVGVAWLDGPLLALLLEHRPRTLLHLYNQQGTQILERLDLDDSLIAHQHVSANSNALLAFHCSLATAPERLVLLTTQGARSARVMSWQERLATLRDLGRWEHAMLTALTLLEAAQASAANGAGMKAGGALHRSSGRGADRNALADALWVLLLAYIDATLPGGSEEAVGEAAETAIDVCLGLGREHLLWSDVVPRFAQAGGASRGRLLEGLLPRIMAGQLQALAPEVMQALVEQCAASGKAAAVERCVLRLDLASLDFNQVTRLCRAHRLHSALAFLFNRALADYAAPAAELLLAYVHARRDSLDESPGGESLDDSPGGRGGRRRRPAAAWGPRRATGYKLLVYLHCCFTGRAFPPGMGDIPGELRASVKAQLLALLLYSTLHSLQQLAAAFGGDGRDGFGLEEESPAEQLLPGPHAVLRCLFHLDAGAVLKILREALEGWDALESDLAEAAGQVMTPAPGAAARSGRSATQAVVDALVDIVGATSTPYMYARPGTSLALEFVADFVVSGRAAVGLILAARLLMHLAAPEQQPTRPGQALGAPRSAPPAGGLSPGGGTDREDRFVAVMMNIRLAGSMFPKALVMREILRLAQRAGFLQAQAQVHHLRGAYGAALGCLLRSPRGAAAAFEYIAAALGGGRAAPRVPPGQLPALKAALLAAMPRLVGADAAAAARLVLRDFPGDHPAVVAALAESPLLQYRYLKGAMEATAEQFAATFDSPTRATAEAAAATAQEALLVQAGAGELYARLLCEFEPAAVLPFLQAHDAYRVEQVLPHTQRFGVDDAQAYLLERLGDVQAALGIFCGAAERANRRLVARILDGSLPAHCLPTPAQGRRSRAVSGGGNAAGQEPTPLAQLFASGTAENLARIREAPADSAAPPELTAAQAALKGAVALCKRHSRDAAPEVSEALWFAVLQAYVAVLRDVRHRERAADERLPAGGIARGDSGDAEHRERLLLVQETLTALMEDVISHMAGYVPLKAIAERILAAYARDPFGDFKGTLVGLLAAFSYELSILHAAARLTHADAFRTLHALYRERTHPLSSSAAAAAAAADAAGDGSGALEDATSSLLSSSPRPQRLAPPRQQSPPTGASLGATPQTPRMQLLANINSGTFAVTAKSIGLMLSPAAEKLRSPPPPSLAGGPTATAGVSPGRAGAAARPGSAEARLRALQPPGRGAFAASPGRLVGCSGGAQGFAEPPSPAHRGGVDINYLRLHDVRLG